MSQRTISNDCSESEQKLLTRDEKEAEVKAVNAKLKLVKPMPAPDRYGTIVIGRNLVLMSATPTAM